MWCGRKLREIYNNVSVHVCHMIYILIRMSVRIAHHVEFRSLKPAHNVTVLVMVTVEVNITISVSITVTVLIRRLLEELLTEVVSEGLGVPVGETGVDDVLIVVSTADVVVSKVVSVAADDDDNDVLNVVSTVDDDDGAGLATSGMSGIGLHGLHSAGMPVCGGGPLYCTAPK